MNSNRRPRHRLTNPLLALLLLLIAPTTCLALTSVEFVDKKRAKELGIEVRTQPSGSKSVSIEIEFKTEGELAVFAKPQASNNVVLILGSHSDSTVAVNLKEDRSKKGRMKVRIIVKRERVHDVSVRLVSYVGRRGVSRKLHMKNFVDLGSIEKKPEPAPAKKKVGKGTAKSDPNNPGPAKPRPGRTGNHPVEEP